MSPVGRGVGGGSTRVGVGRGAGADPIGDSHLLKGRAAQCVAGCEPTGYPTGFHPVANAIGILIKHIVVCGCCTRRCARAIVGIRIYRVLDNDVSDGGSPSVFDDKGQSDGPSVRVPGLGLDDG